MYRSPTTNHLISHSRYLVAVWLLVDFHFESSGSLTVLCRDPKNTEPYVQAVGVQGQSKLERVFSVLDFGSRF